MKRDRLITYLAEIDDEKVKALYTILQADIDSNVITNTFTEQQLKILEERRASLFSGSDKGIDWQTMHNNIRHKRKTA